MQLISTTEVSATIALVQPLYVAVAYVGKDWQTLIDPTRLLEIIVSPTLGSNPESIEEIVSILGWEHVHFLTRLHSKIYIGAKSVAFGSFNLSRNGILADGLEEFGVYIDAPEAVNDLNAEFDRIRDLAIAEHPTERDKREALQRLSVHRNRAWASRIIAPDANVRNLMDYHVITDHDFYVVWYSPGTPELNPATIKKAAPDIPIDAFEADELKYTTVLDSAPVEQGDWLLLWQIRNDGLPHHGVSPQWLFADYVIPNGVATNDGYTKLIVQKQSSYELPPPFSLDKLTKAALYRTLSTENYRTLRFDGETDWSIRRSQECLFQFVADLKAHLQNDD